jgi:CheY-like chemotaxis protein
MDPGHLQQVLMNLAVNARDAMATGGTLTIRTRNVESPGPAVELTVCDDGPGMAPEVRERAFEPFFTTKPPGQGTGLGLATVHGIVHQASGDVWIEDAPGSGVMVTVVLPSGGDVRADAIRPVVAASPVAGRTVLLVEDEDAVREVAARILTRNGCRVIAAANGIDALAMARDHSDEIDALVTDVIMPHMLGRVLADEIRGVCGPLPVLFMSGYAHPVLTSEGTLEPGVVLLEKPFTESELLEKLGAVLNPPRSA